VRLRLLTCCSFVFFLFSAPTLVAEPAEPHPGADPHPVTDIFVVRGSETLQSPHQVGYRLVEWAQQRGRWIAPDFGYYDTGYAHDQLWFVGAGADVLHRRHMLWTEEIYLAQANGSEAHNQRSMWLWTVFELNLRKRLSAELVSYPTLPLDHAQPFGYDIDRFKMEWKATPHWLVGPGYTATTLAPGYAWQSRPFLTATRKSHNGDYEVWLQRIPTGAQVQLRYMLVRDER